MKDRSQRVQQVLGTSQVATVDDWSRQQPVVVMTWQSSARYCGDKPCSALYTKTAILNSMRCRTGSRFMACLSIIHGTVFCYTIHFWVLCWGSTMLCWGRLIWKGNPLAVITARTWKARYQQRWRYDVSCEMHCTLTNWSVIVKHRSVHRTSGIFFGLLCK